MFQLEAKPSSFLPFESSDLEGDTVGQLTAWGL